MMLSVSDIGDDLGTAYEHSKEIGARVVKALKTVSAPGCIEGGTDCLTAYPDSVIGFTDGILKYEIDTKCVRFYSSNDLYVNGSTRGAGRRLFSDFAADAVIVPLDTFNDMLGRDSDLRDTWSAYCLVSANILLGLCASYMHEGSGPDVSIRQVEAGEILIREGDKPDFLFEMIEGRAAVSAEGQCIGEINQGEIFGEISFLTESPRSATVTAVQRCIVQAVHGDQFERFATARPSLLFSLSQTLANRLLQVNKRLKKIWVT